MTVRGERGQAKRLRIWRVKRIAMRGEARHHFFASSILIYCGAFVERQTDESGT